MKPFFQRASTWRSILIGGIVFGLSYLLGCGIGSAYLSVQTEKVTASIVSKRHHVKYIIRKWQAKRRFNEGKVPNCAWNVGENEFYVCDWEDTLGNCVFGHWEVDYDYNVMDWVDFKDTLKDCKDTLCWIPFPYFSDQRKWRINKSDHYYVTVVFRGDRKEFKVPHYRFKVNDTISAVIYKRSGVIKKITPTE